MNNTLYISDLDGTLFTPQARLSSYAAQNLRRFMQGGLHFSIASARAWPKASIILKDILPLSAPAVLLNGALIYDTQTQEYVRKEIIQKEQLRALLCAAKAQGQKGFLYSIREGSIRLYHEDLSGWPVLQAFLEERTSYYDFVHMSDLALCAGEDIVYFTTQNTREKLAPLHEAVQALPGIDSVLYEDTYLAGNWFLECFSHTASKYNAVRFLREKYSYKKIIGFGDNLNDIALFKACDEAYAVANARDPLKAMANGVIGPNTEDGVVKFLMESSLCGKPGAG